MPSSICGICPAFCSSFGDGMAINIDMRSGPGGMVCATGPWGGDDDDDLMSAQIRAGGGVGRGRSWVYETAKGLHVSQSWCSLPAFNVASYMTGFGGFPLGGIQVPFRMASSIMRRWRRRRMMVRATMVAEMASNSKSTPKNVYKYTVADVPPPRFPFPPRPSLFPSRPPPLGPCLLVGLGPKSENVDEGEKGGVKSSIVLVVTEDMVVRSQDVQCYLAVLSNSLRRSMIDGPETRT